MANRTDERRIEAIAALRRLRMLAGVDAEVNRVERIGRLGARLILQWALEDEVTEFRARPLQNARSIR